ncbi:MAG: ArsR family transcriptional regulator [Clostridiales bacterium]|jgi:DNA-binding transcriptional ArsR family regulator|nr:ArsR family transcriptional regulator [Clostridiales bacterium]
MQKLGLRYNKNLGIIHDSFWFMVHKFNIERTKNILQEYDWDEKAFFLYYVNVDVKIDERLRPFFYMVNDNTFMMSFFFNHIQDCLNSDMETFLDEINVEEFKVSFADFYEVDPLLSDMINNTLSEFDELFTELKEQMRLVQYKIGRYHNDERMISKLMYEFRFSEILSKVSANYNIPNNVLRRSNLTISYISPYCMRIIENDPGCILIIGVKYKDYLDKLMPQSYEYLDINRVGKMLGHPVKVKIIELLQHHGALSVAQLDRFLKIPIGNVYKLVSKMYDDKVLVCHERTDREVYYDINPEYFDIMLEVVKDFANGVSREERQNLDYNKI